MPIDEAKLEETIVALGVKAQELLDQRQELIDEQSRLNKIRIIKAPQFDPDTGVKLETTKDRKPKSEFSNEEMTDKERQQIYDAVLPRAEALLEK